MFFVVWPAGVASIIIGILSSVVEAAAECRRTGLSGGDQPGKVTTSAPVRVTTMVCSYWTVGAHGSL